MTTIIIDGKSFSPTAIKHIISNDCSIDGETKAYMEYYFIENGKEHFVREEMHEDGEGCYVVNENSKAQWFIKE